MSIDLEFNYTRDVNEKFVSNELKACILSISPLDLKYKFISETSFIKYKAIPKHISKVCKFQEDMKTGKWVNYRELFKIKRGITPIIFFENGRLWAGKHRMIALSLQESNLLLDFVCILGWDFNRRARNKYVMSKETKEFRKKCVLDLIQSGNNEIKLEYPFGY